MLIASYLLVFQTQAYESELQNPKQNQQHCFRSNWRSNVRMPWSPAVPSNFLNEDDVNPKCLFVDVTFDFLIFPSEVVSEGRTKSCHVVKKADFCGETFQGNDTSDEASSIALSVAIRIGALVAIPSCQCSDISSTSGSKRDVDGGIKNDYQYYYMRGEKALTVADLDDHCSSIEIIREGMNSKDVANIVGTAFLDGCTSAFPWKVVAKKQSMPKSDNSLDDLTNDLTTIDGSMSKQSKNQSTLICHLKLHDKSFNADGILPLSSNGGVGSSLDRSMLDMILLQSSTNSGEGNIVPVPKTEALSLWRVVDESLIKALEKPIEPSPQKMSPASLKVAAKAESPPQKAAPKEEETKITEQPRKVVIRRPPKPQEQALFARGKKTTLGGGRRKKPKFRMGPA